MLQHIFIIAPELVDKVWNDVSWYCECDVDIQVILFD